LKAALKSNVRQLLHNIIPILLLANLGVLAATLITGYALHWEIGIPLVTALLFGAIISATDPISVLAIFKELAVAKRLAVIVEAASLFNDGTAVVLFQILLAGILTGNLSIPKGLGTIGPLISMAPAFDHRHARRIRRGASPPNRSFRPPG